MIVNSLIVYFMSNVCDQLQCENIFIHIYVHRDSDDANTLPGYNKNSKLTHSDFWLTALDLKDFGLQHNRFCPWYLV